MGQSIASNPNAFPYQVPAVQLDTLLRDEPHIDLVKMDIEGAEGLALAGMQQLIARHRPIIFTEFSPNALQLRSGLTPEEFLTRLRDLRYDLHVLHRIGGQNLTPQNNQEIMVDFANYQSDHLDLVAYPALVPERILNIIDHFYDGVSEEEIAQIGSAMRRRVSVFGPESIAEDKQQESYSRSRGDF